MSIPAQCSWEYAARSHRHLVQAFPVGCGDLWQGPDWGGVLTSQARSCLPPGPSQALEEGDQAWA